MKLIQLFIFLALSISGIVSQTCSSSQDIITLECEHRCCNKSNQCAATLGECYLFSDSDVKCTNQFQATKCQSTCCNAQGLCAKNIDECQIYPTSSKEKTSCSKDNDGHCEYCCIDDDKCGSKSECNKETAQNIIIGGVAAFLIILAACYCVKQCFKSKDSSKNNIQIKHSPTNSTANNKQNQNFDSNRGDMNNHNPQYLNAQQQQNTPIGSTQHIGNVSVQQTNILNNGPTYTPNMYNQQQQQQQQNNDIQINDVVIQD